MKNESMMIGDILNETKATILTNITECFMVLDFDHERAVHIDCDELTEIVNNSLTEALKRIESKEKKATQKECCGYEEGGFIYAGYWDNLHYYQHQSTGHTVGIRNDELLNNQLKEFIRIGYSRPIKPLIIK
jgi:hypothetical protein